MRGRQLGLLLLGAGACTAPFSPPPSEAQAWTPRQVRVAPRHDGTIEDELLRPDRSVSLIVTSKHNHPQRLRSFDRHGREAWDCEIIARAPPRCAVRAPGGQLLDPTARARLDANTAARLAALPEPRSARDRRWLERAEELQRRGLPLTIAATLAREELSSGTLYLPERRPISEAEHWH